MLFLRNAIARGDMRIANEEIFGPVLSAFKWKDEDEVIEIANSVEYGLSGAVWSKDLSTALRTAKRIKSGYIWVNGVGAHYPSGAQWLEWIHQGNPSRIGPLELAL